MAEAPDLLDSELTAPEIKRYHRYQLIATCFLWLAILSFLTVAAFLAGPTIDAYARGRVRGPAWFQPGYRLVNLVIIYVVCLALVTLPIRFWSGFLLEHRYQLSNQKFKDWALSWIRGWALICLLAAMLFVGLYFLLWHAGPWWWVAATSGYFLVMLMVSEKPTEVFPQELPRLEDQVLLDRLRLVAERAGIAIKEIKQWKLSQETKRGNAAWVGLGHSGQVLLSDTLLERLTPEEIEVIFAHELGHHVHRHVVKLVVVSTVVMGIGLCVVNQVLHGASVSLGYASFDDPGALPLVLLVLAIVFFMLAPIQNVLHRRFERMCDCYALELTRRPNAYRSAFSKLARMNKEELDPHPLEVWFLYDHPPLRERLRIANDVQWTAATQPQSDNSA